VAQKFGNEAAIAVAEAVDTGSLRMPTGKPFIAAHFRSKNYTINQIARELHVTVRGWLKSRDGT